MKLEKNLVLILSGVKGNYFHTGKKVPDFCNYKQK